MSSNPIKYTSRDFSSIMDDINSDSELVDKPIWWKRIWAGIGDVLSMWLNAQANQSYLRTAFTRQAVVDLCRLIDYELASQQTSNGDLIFHLDADVVTFPFTISKTDLVATSQGSSSLSSKRFEARVAITVSSQETENATHSSSVWTVARSYKTGEKIRLVTTGTLPSPLLIDTDYYVIRINATSIKLAYTIEDAFDGIFINSSSGSGTHQIRLWSFIHTVYQQISNPTVVIGRSDGITEWQMFDIPAINLLEDTLVITINGVTWTKVTTFVNSGIADRHFKLFFRTDNTCYIMFGNGILGAIPGNFDINASFATGGGTDSNIYELNAINSYSGTDSRITGVCNADAITGGSDPESIANAKALAPTLLKARDRFITVDDGESLALSYGGISIVKVNKNVYGLLSCQVIIVPNGGGTSSAGFKTALADYLTRRTILESITINVLDATYVTQNIVGSFKVLPGYSFTNVLPFAVLATRLLFTEIGKEILNIYNSDGIILAVELINDKFSTTFISDDYEQISLLLDNLEPADIAKSYQDSDIKGFIDTFVYGIDYIIISSPTFPITTTDEEITEIGTVNYTEIT